MKKNTKDVVVPNLGEKLKRWRLEANLSQAALGERASLSSGYVGLIERGDRDPSMTVVCALLNALGVGPAVFFADEGVSPRTYEFETLFKGAPMEVRQAVLLLLKATIEIERNALK